MAIIYDFATGKVIPPDPPPTVEQTMTRLAAMIAKIDAHRAKYGEQ